MAKTSKHKPKFMTPWLCPFCGSKRIEDDGCPQNKGDCVRQFMTCSDCEREFTLVVDVSYATGMVVSISLAEIYEMAAQLGERVTQAEY